MGAPRRASRSRSRPRKKPPARESSEDDVIQPAVSASRVPRSRSRGKDGTVTTGNDKRKKKALPFPEIYWGGCAFGSAFYVGVYKALWEEYDIPQLMKDGLTISGGSAGAIFGLLTAIGYTPTEMDAVFRRILGACPPKAPWHNPWTNYGSSVATVMILKEIFAADPDIYKKIEGVVAVGTTQWYSKHAWHISWKNNDDLLDTLRGSMHVPFYCHKNVRINGTICVDGAYGFAGHDLRHGDETLYIGIDPHAEITRHFNYVEMFFPPQGKDYDDMVETGYIAAKKWCRKKIHTKKVGIPGGPAYRTPNWEALRFLWVFKYFEEYGEQIRLVLIALLVYYIYSYNTNKPCCDNHGHHHHH